MPTYTQIGSAVTVGSGGAASIDFSSIPSTYTDLVLKLSGRSAYVGTDEVVKVIFNGSTAAAYQIKRLYGTGSVSASDQDSAGTTVLNFYQVDSSTSTASTFGNAEFYIPNYAGSTYKSISGDLVTENNATRGVAALGAGLWSNTAAINQITLTPQSNLNWLQYTTAYLYGVSNA